MIPGTNEILVVFFFVFQSLRVKYYKQGDRVSETELAKEMLEYSDERRPWESMEEKLTLIRDLMRKVVRKVSEKSE